MAWEKQKGFTIVELLIVVVVIAILAAITVVAFNGVQERAKASAAQSATAQAAHKLAAFAPLNNDTYPNSLSVDGVNLVDTDKTTYQYRVGADLKSFCLTATTNGKSYYVSSSALTPTEGACAGHGANGATVVTNRLRNPSLEINLADVGYMGGTGTDSIMERTADWANSGTQSLRVSKSVASGLPKGVRITLPDVLVAGDVVRWSAVVRNSGSNSSARTFRPYGERSSPSYTAYVSSGDTTLNPSGSARITGQVTITAANNAAGETTGFGILPVGTQYAVGENYLIDSFIVTVNEPLPSSYADGNTPGWLWLGAPYGSTSTGPLL